MSLAIASIVTFCAAFVTLLKTLVFSCAAVESLNRKERELRPSRKKGMSESVRMLHALLANLTFNELGSSINRWHDIRFVRDRVVVLVCFAN